ncbi:MAG: MipA/OmpV family protein [Cellvibrionaceae bacterium]
MPLYKILSVVVFLPLISFGVYAKELPLWELGLGAGALHQSYYTGTKQTRSYAFPVVLGVYRGEFLKSDDKGIRAQLFKDERFKLDLSFDFNFAVDSDEIDLRQGMDDIGSLLEVGPSLEVKLFESESNKWFLRFPLRGVMEIDDGEFSTAGYNFSPSIALEKKFLGTSWKTGASIAFKFGDQKYNSIYYSVDPEFATTDREAYQADSGYAGSRLQLSLTSKSSKNLLVFFLRYDDISGAVYDDSPLVETKSNTTVGVLYTRYIFKSKRFVNRDE